MCLSSLLCDGSGTFRRREEKGERKTEKEPKQQGCESVCIQDLCYGFSFFECGKRERERERMYPSCAMHAGQLGIHPLGQFRNELSCVIGIKQRVHGLVRKQVASYLEAYAGLARLVLKSKRREQSWLLVLKRTAFLRYSCSCSTFLAVLRQ